MRLQQDSSKLGLVVFNRFEESYKRCVIPVLKEKDNQDDSTHSMLSFQIETKEDKDRKQMRLFKELKEVQEALSVYINLEFPDISPIQRGLNSFTPLSKSRFVNMN